MVFPSLTVFGSQIGVPDREYHSSITSFLRQDKNTAPLLQAIDGLPQWWDEVSKSHKVLQKLPGHDLLDGLRQWLVGGAQFELQTPAPNVILGPLTVISHAVEYLSYLRSQPATHAEIWEVAGAKGFQGLCIGHLAAVACASARSEREFIEQAAVVLRLAVLIGATVDLDGRYAEPAKKWTCIVARRRIDASPNAVSEAMSDYPDAFISVHGGPFTSTLTLLKHDVADLTAKLKSSGVVVRELELHGRFHATVHRQAVTDLVELCEARPELQFNSVSGTSAPSILHILADILLSPSSWHDTLSGAMQRVQRKNGRILSVGRESAVPDSTARLYSMSVSQACDNFQSHGENTPSLTYPEHAVAVIGMACKFPGASSTNEFWELLMRGQMMVSKVPSDRFASDLWGNFVQDVGVFDHKFFGKSPREAAAMDPQQRLLLQVAYQAVASAGFFARSETSPTNKDVGCFIGCGSSDYGDNMAGHAPGAFSILGALRGLLSGRVSHHFGWEGPSITFDTACASSMAAIHAACQALQLRECDAAVAGGVNVITSPNYYNALDAAGFLGKTGSSRAFDARADGYCRGEGAGLVVLKRLDRALEDGDNVIGVISATAIMQNRKDGPINVPSVVSQVKLFRAVVDRAQVEADDVTFVEAHGTGTQVGDCIEAESIRQVFGSDRRTSRLYLGSVKDNIGHTEGAAGVAGLIKVLLMINQGQIAPQPGFGQLNPKIAPLENNNIAIARKVQPWSTESDRVACVNNYGAGGCNGALVVCSGPARGRQRESLRASCTTSYPFSISAKSIASLRTFCHLLKQWLESRQPHLSEARLISDVAFSLFRTQNHKLEYCITFVATTLPQLCEKLTSCMATESIPKPLSKTKTDPVILVFGGQTGRCARLSANIYASSSLLRSHLTECDRTLQQLGYKSIVPSICSGVVGDDHDLVSAHSALFAVQYATAKCWLECGLQVAALIGHSFGQLTALCIGGVLSLEDALEFVLGRAALIQQHWHGDPGAMVAVEADLDTVTQLVETVKSLNPHHEVDVACHNGPTSYVLAGTTSAMGSVAMVASKWPLPLRNKKLDVPYAFHSSLTAPILPGLTALARKLHYRPPQIQIELCFESPSNSEITPAILAQHTRSSVFFHQAIRRLEVQFGPCTWLEAGHGSPVVDLVRRSLSKGAIADHVFRPLRCDNQGLELANIAKSFAERGQPAAFWPFHSSDNGRYNILDLPPYQFERNIHWLPYIEPKLAKSGGELPSEEHPYLRFNGYSDASRRIATFTVDRQSERLRLLVEGHAVLGMPLCPASAYVDLASQAAVLLLSADTKSAVPQFENLCIEAPLGLGNSSNVVLSLTQTLDSSNAWSASFESVKGDNVSTIHARVTIRLRARNDASPSAFSSFDRLVDANASERLLEDQQAQCLSGPIIYRLFEKTVTYSGVYRGVQRVASAERETAAYIKFPRSGSASLARGPCHPIAMDNFLQVAGIHVNFIQQDLNDEVYIANHIGNIMYSSDGLETDSHEDWLVYAKYSPTDGRVVNSDIFVFSKPTRKLAIVLLGVRFTRVLTKSLTKILRGANAIALDDDCVATVMPEADQFREMPDHPAAHSRTLPAGESHALLCALLGAMLDVPTAQIETHTKLADLGIDSLMMTEIASGIRETFSITIATSELLILEDIQALSQRLFSNSSGMQLVQGTTPLQNVDRVSSSSTSTANTSTALSSIESELQDIKLPAIATESFHGAFLEVSQQFDMFATGSLFLGYWKDVYPLHLRLVTAYITTAFAALGFPLESVPTGAPLPVVKIHRRHSQLYSRLLEILVESGLAQERADGTFLRSQLPVHPTSPTALHAEIIRKFPQYESEHQLLEITGHEFAQCLGGNKNAVDLLFGSKTSRDLLADVYANAPIFKAATSMLAHFLVESLKMRPQTEPICILEIGAGTGGTTTFLVEELLRARINFIYTFTDISSSLVNKAKAKFAGIPNMRFRVLDVEKPSPMELRGMYHIAISTNCIHATPDLVTSCEHIRDFLRPNGVLALVELTRKMAWYDVVFGLLEGWWAFTDDRSHALVDEHVWDKNLRAAGFEDVRWSTGDSEESSNIRVICGFKQEQLSASTRVWRATEGERAYAATSILIQGSTSGFASNVFAFPGGFGTAATYTPLPVLHPSIAVYGLNSPFLKSPSTFDTSLGELTGIYLEEITRIQPRGPYTLMGYSVGGVMAYEASRQLIERGEEVRQLILLDSACPALIPPFPLSLLDFFDGIDRFKGTQQDAKTTETPFVADEKQTSSANGAKKMTDPHVIATLQSLHKYDPARMPAGKSPPVLLLAARSGIDPARVVPRPEVNDMEQRVIQWVLDDRRDFTPGGFGWDRLIDSEMVEVIPVDGNHFSLMTEPHISRAAGELRKRLGVDV